MSDDIEAPWDEDTVPRSVATAARIAGRRFSQFASRDDLSQEAWAWVCSHPSKVSEWESLGDAGRRKLVRALINTCVAYGQKEKAERSGYRAGDNFYYGLGLLREVIPTILENGLDIDDPKYAEFQDRAMWLDVCTALGSLSESEYQIVWWAFKDDPEEEQGINNVASHLDLTYDAARQRINRVLRKAQAALGGESPVPRRSRKSNAQALAEIRSAYDGEG